MEVLRELDIAKFLTRGGKVFISPAFHISFNQEARDGGTDPDIVALDFGAREILVVEVTTASILSKLFERIHNRQTDWFIPVKRHLKEIGTGTDEWSIRLLGFVRRTNVDTAKARFVNEADVIFFAIEDATFDWVYTKERTGLGLPR